MRRRSSPLDDALDRLVARLVDLRRPQRLLFTGAARRVGTSTIAFGVARRLGRAVAAPVAFVDAGGSPILADRLEMARAPGLSAVLRGDVEPRRAWHELRDLNLRVFSAGPSQSGLGPVSSESSERFGRAIDGCDNVVIDVPPLTVTPEATVFLDARTAVVVVARAGRTPQRDARAAIEFVRASDAILMGVVLNRFVPDLPFGMSTFGWDQA